MSFMLCLNEVNQATQLIEWTEHEFRTHTVVFSCFVLKIKYISILDVLCLFCSDI